MKDIFTELYNKVISFFLNEKSENTKEIASNRLKLVLMHDRTKLDPLTIEKMRLELVDVISKYIVIDKDLLELNLAGEGNSIALMLNIPVIRAKTEEELAEIRTDEEEHEDSEDEKVEEETVEKENPEKTIETETDSHNNEKGSSIELEQQDSLNEVRDSENSDVKEHKEETEKKSLENTQQAPSENNVKNTNKSKQNSVSEG